MVGFILRRVLIIPLVLLLVNFIGFAFAHITFQLQQQQTIYGSGKEGFTPVWPEYENYILNVLQGDLGPMPVKTDQTIAEVITNAGLASLGLFGIALILSIFLGLSLGLAAVQVDPPRSMRWLTFVSTTGLAMPSFYIGSLLIGGFLLQAIKNNADPLIPINGFGWDAHLILPVLALVIRPTMQIAQVSSSLLSGELGKRYIVAERSFGYTWRAIRWDKALRNVLAPVILTIASSFRLLLGELLLVEWLFGWPGLGRLLVQTLVPPNLSSVGGMLDTSRYFLNPPLVAAVLVVFAFYFLLADTLASGLARGIDPRLRAAEEETIHD